VRSSRHPLYTAPSGTTTPTGTMSLSGATGFAAGYDLHMILNRPLKFLIKTLLVTMIYMMCSLLVDMFHVMFLFNLNMLYASVMFTMNMMFWFIMNKHLITTIFIIPFYWIKLNLKLIIFLTIQKHDYRHFSSVGFAGFLKPSPFEGTHYKRWR
jgi:hypothetical protein